MSERETVTGTLTDAERRNILCGVLASSVVVESCGSAAAHTIADLGGMVLCLLEIIDVRDGVVPYGMPSREYQRLVARQTRQYMLEARK